MNNIISKINRVIGESAKFSYQIDFAGDKNEIEHFKKEAKKKGIFVSMIKASGPGGHWPVLKVTGDDKNNVIAFLKANYDENIEDFI